MFLKIKYQIVKFIESIPLLQIFVYNNLNNFKFLFPHDKDYLALKILFKKNERRDFIDIGGNIGLSTIVLESWVLIKIIYTYLNQTTN